MTLTRGGPDYPPQLQEELLRVVQKYVEVDRGSGCEIPELDITLPDE